MDNKNRRNNLTSNDVEIIKNEIIEACKHNKTDFTINTEQLVKNINNLFGKNYSIETVSYVLGFLYEEQFYYRERFI